MNEGPGSDADREADRPPAPLLPVVHPEIDADLCVHGLCATASCKVCVDACPRQAFSMDDRALSLDPNACDGCGLCRPACPQAAIDFPGRSFDAYIDQDSATALLACEMSGVEATTGVVSCLHAAGLRDLDTCVALGVETVVTARGDCAKCPRATPRTLDLALVQFNLQRLSARQSPLKSSGVSAAAWQAARTRASARGNDIDQSRRGIFGLKNNQDVTRRAVAQVAGAVPEGALFRFVPVIDETRCNGCDACTRICPHAALQLDVDAARPGYRIDAANCTGCNLCADVCDPAAISLTALAPLVVRTVPLRQARCSKCGAPFHQPASSTSPNATICWICQRKNHAGMLFQVRD